MSRWRRGWRWGALAVTLAAGCAGSPPPSDAFHRLVLPASPARPEPLLAGIVEVERLAASDVLRARALAVSHVERPERLRQSDYHFWVDAPPVLVQYELVAYLRDRGVAERVVTPEQRARAEWIVSGRIERFEREAGGGPGQATVSVELSLRRRQGRELLVHGVYRVARAARDPSVEASVDAMGAALGDAFAAFVADVEAALARRG